MDKTRVDREKEWHNSPFGHNARAKIDKYYSIVNPVHKQWDKITADYLQKDATVFLDYGCGAGLYLIRQASMIKKGVGIDISEALINQAEAEMKTANAGNLEFLVMDAMNTSFEDDFFDIIHGHAILHHLDLKKSLEEIKRILKDDGKAFFIEPLDTNPIFKMYRKMTPAARTADERPFRRKDLQLIKLIFPAVEIKYYFFLSLLAVPFNKRKKIFNKILSILYLMDKIILNKYTPFKWLAWSCAIVLKK